MDGIYRDTWITWKVPTRHWKKGEITHRENVARTEQSQGEHRANPQRHRENIQRTEQIHAEHGEKPTDAEEDKEKPQGEH